MAVKKAVAKAAEATKIGTKAEVMTKSGLGKISQKREDEEPKEIQSMRHLLDIMAKNIKGKLTEQDKMELKDKAEEWSRDIDTLTEMLNKSLM